MRSSTLRWAPSFYFIYYAAAAALSPFLIIYYQELGLKGSQIGLLAGIPALVSLISGPIWGLLSDLTQKQKTILLTTITGSILLGLAISTFKTFVWLVPVVILFSFFFSPIMPLVDSTTMFHLGGQKEKYGQVRMWGAIGWGISAPIVGWWMESHSIMGSFWAYAALMGLGWLIALSIPVSGQIGPVTAGGLKNFLNNRRWLIFMVFTFCSGMVLSMITSFLFIYLKEMGASSLTLGLSLTFATLSEIPILYFSNLLLRHWPAQKLMAASFLAFSIRAFSLTLIVVPWIALLIQLLHGPSFSLMWTSGVSYADKIAPSGMSATAQGLFSGALLGIGSATGSMLGGIIYQQWGLISLFRLAALIALVIGGIAFLMESQSDERPL
jgi:PPP family 3-phenylpropionic acid transporter